MKKIFLKNAKEVIKALIDGKTIKDSFNHEYKLVENFIVMNGKDVGSEIGEIVHPYIEEEEQLKIEVGKYYKTRDGRVARCFYKLPYDKYPSCSFTIDGYSFVFSTHYNGKLYIEEDNNKDIIEEYQNDNKK